MIVTLSRMAKKTFFNTKKDATTSFMFPLLHQRVLDAVSPQISSPWFNNKEADVSNKDYPTNVMGNFKCNSDNCKGSWSSGKVAIVIRSYSGNGYNATVFNQRCKLCKQLGTLTLDENSYVERVAYRLKKWAGIRQERPAYDHKKTLPHKRKLCEGCNQGHCEMGGNRED